MTGSCCLAALLCLQEILPGLHQSRAALLHGLYPPLQFCRLWSSSIDNIDILDRINHYTGEAGKVLLRQPELPLGLYQVGGGAVQACLGFVDSYDVAGSGRKERLCLFLDLLYPVQFDFIQLFICVCLQAAQVGIKQADNQILTGGLDTGVGAADSFVGRGYLVIGGNIQERQRTPHAVTIAGELAINISGGIIFHLVPKLTDCTVGADTRQQGCPGNILVRLDAIQPRLGTTY